MIKLTAQHDDGWCYLHGRKAVLCTPGEETEGKLCWENNELYFLHNNVIYDGGKPAIRHGYTYGWVLCRGEIVTDNLYVYSSIDRGRAEGPPPSHTEQKEEKVGISHLLEEIDITLDQTL